MCHPDTRTNIGFVAGEWAVGIVGCPLRSSASVHAVLSRVDGPCQLRPGDRAAERGCDMEGEGGAAGAQVPHAGMPTGDDVGADALLAATHRPQPLLQMPMIPRKAGVEVLGAAMFNCRQDGAEGRA